MSALTLAGGVLAGLMGLTGCVDEPDPAAYEHHDVVATVFWVGEGPSADNGGIANDVSAWDGNWQENFGGVDDPNRRQAGGYWPADFQPKENPFYCALPYGEYTADGRVKDNARSIPWYDPADPPTAEVSLLKNRWVEVTHAGRAAYAQWEDVGPFEEDDVDYVFGAAAPEYEQAGIDLSPATAHYLGINGRATVSWRFVEADEVPQGPWLDIVTTRQISRR